MSDSVGTELWSPIPAQVECFDTSSGNFLFMLVHSIILFLCTLYGIFLRLSIVVFIFASLQFVSFFFMLTSVPSVGLELTILQ